MIQTTRCSYPSRQVARGCSARIGSTTSTCSRCWCPSRNAPVRSASARRSGATLDLHRVCLLCLLRRRGPGVRRVAGAPRRGTRSDHCPAVRIAGFREHDHAGCVHRVSTARLAPVADRPTALHRMTNTLPAFGEAAPDFSLSSTSGSEMSLSSLKGKNVLLAFFPLAFTSHLHDGAVRHARRLGSVRDR